MISEEEFNRVNEKYIKMIGKEKAYKEINDLVIRLETFKKLMLVIDPGCDIVKEVNKLLNKYRTDHDQYSLLKNIPGKFKHIYVPDEYYVNMRYEKMIEEIKKGENKNV